MVGCGALGQLAAPCGMDVARGVFRVADRKRVLGTR